MLARLRVHFIEGFPEPLDDVGVLRGHVVLLAGIVLQIEELHRSRRIAGHQAGDLVGRRLLVRREDADAVGSAWIGVVVPWLVAGGKSDARLEHMQLPARIAHGREFGRLLAEDDFVRAFRIAREQREDVAPVNHPPLRRHDARDVQRRGKQVHHHRGLRAEVARRNFPGPPRDARHAIAALVGTALHSPQRAVATAERCTVVAGEHHECIVSEAERL